MEELIYFELNNWFPGKDYPNEEPFIGWIKEDKFSDNEWCKQNKLVVLTGCVDMSRNWCIIATKRWVELNCPKLLEDYTHTYTIISHTYESGKPVDITTEHNYNITDFLRHPDADGEVYGVFGWHFPEYSSDNYGVIWHDEA